jgi:hypothetical protein
MSRITLTLEDEVIEKLGRMSAKSGLTLSRLVTHACTELVKNGMTLRIDAVSLSTRNAPVSHAAPMLNPRGEPMVPPEAFMTPSNKRRVDRVNFKVPICAECTLDVTEEQIGRDDMHIGCPGRT